MTRIIILLLCTAFLGACAHVEPWQKSELGQPYMQARSSQWGDAFRTHAIITVEQAEGGDGLAGGGCGCR